MLDLVGLKGKESRKPDELSGGEQQRVAIARAFVNRPMILIADEPTGNLDPLTSVGIMRLLDRINRTGTTVVMATHDDDIVDQMRKRVIELEGGKVVRDQSRGCLRLLALTEHGRHGRTAAGRPRRTDATTTTNRTNARDASSSTRSASACAAT